MPTLQNWIPIRIYWQNGEPMVDWCYASQRRFLLPFHSDDIALLLRKPFNQAFRQQTSISVLLERQRETLGQAIRPSGFIFHLSRCGSTLISQALASSSRNVVLSEAEPIDTILRTRYFFPEIGEEDQIEWLRAVIQVLLLPRNGEERGFIKLDSWHVAHFPLLKKVFPDVPMIFLYRDPVEIIVSQLKRRGVQTIPGSMPGRVLGITVDEAMIAHPEIYIASVLSKVCQSALEFGREKLRLVNYTELPTFVWEKLPAIFNLDLSEEEIQSIMRATERDAKEPGFTFQPDSARKQNEASEAVRSVSNRLVFPYYEQFESLRLRQSE